MRAQPMASAQAAPSATANQRHRVYHRPQGRAGPGDEEFSGLVEESSPAHCQTKELQRPPPMG